MRICGMCGKAFERNKGSPRIYCDDDCSRLAGLKQMQEYRYRNRDKDKPIFKKPHPVDKDYLNTLAIMTLEEVGQELGISYERVRQIEAKAFHKLRLAIMKNPALREYIKDGFNIEDDFKKCLKYKGFLS